jgi:hypothetical protein
MLVEEAFVLVLKVLKVFIPLGWEKLKDERCNMTFVLELLNTSQTLMVFFITHDSSESQMITFGHF